MGKLVLITGGARSGKSRFAENLARGLQGPVLYVATAQIFDEEMKIRVRKHRESRPAEWDTLEAYRGLGKTISSQDQKYCGILIDCITIMVTNLMWEIPEIQAEEFTVQNIEKAEFFIMEEVKDLVEGTFRMESTVIMVTNELGSGIVPEYPLSRAFRDIAGRVNQYIAAHADEVYLVVCGIPLRIK